MLRDSTPRFVCLSIGWLVNGHTLLLYDFYSLTALLRPERFNDLRYGPCPPARDWGSRVSGILFFLCQELRSDFEPFRFESPKHFARGSDLAQRWTSSRLKSTALQTRRRGRRRRRYLRRRVRRNWFYLIIAHIAENF